MSRDQIEEMAVTTCSLYRRYLDKKCGGNSDCDFNCHHYTRCENLYNAGYRKQSDKDSSKGCEYCKGRAYTKKPLTVITKYGRRIELVFEFCPNCGRKMKGGAE